MRQWNLTFGQTPSPEIPPVSCICQLPISHCAYYGCHGNQIANSHGGMCSEPQAPHKSHRRAAICCMLFRQIPAIRIDVIRGLFTSRGMSEVPVRNQRRPSQACWSCFMHRSITLASDMTSSIARAFLEAK